MNRSLQRIVALVAVISCGMMVGCSSAPTQEAAASTVGAKPFLMFQNGQAQDAVDLYTSTIPDVHVVEMDLYGEGDPGPAGTVQFGILSVRGLEVAISDSPVTHAFDFTPSISMFMTCASADELDALATALSAEGAVMMPPGDYGFSDRFAWVQDRFGVSWQLIYGQR